MTYIREGGRAIKSAHLGRRTHNPTVIQTYNNLCKHQSNKNNPGDSTTVDTL